MPKVSKTCLHYIFGSGCTAAIVIALTVSAFMIALCFWQVRSRFDFEQLLQGNKNVEITSFVIKAGAGEVIIDDRVSVRYLTRAIRQSSRDGYQLGSSYYASITLSSGTKIECGLYLPADKLTITICFPLDAIDRDESYYRINLPQPIPQPLNGSLSSLWCRKRGHSELFNNSECPLFPRKLINSCGAGQ